MKGKYLQKSYQVGPFLVIPLAMIATGWLYIQSSGLYFLRSVDPEYGYLLNGLLLACFKPDVQFITNPGVPVHFIVAIVSGIVHLFRPGQPLVDDVLSNPELYIRATLVAINLLNATVVYCLGYIAYRHTKNMMVSFFLQLMPFTNLLTLEASARLMPESLMCIVVCFWLMGFLRLLYKDDQQTKYHRYSLIFGLLFSIGLADKLTFLPYFILPLIILPGWKTKLSFAGYAFIFFMVVAFPVALSYKFFTRWIADMFTHTGAYGGGDPGFAKWNEFVNHLTLLVNNTPFLLWSVIALVLSVLLYFLIKKRATWNSLQVRLNVALVALVVLQYLMASKQFAYHYMIPSILLTPFIVLMITETLTAVFPIAKKAVNGFMLIAGILLVVHIVPEMTSQLKGMKAFTKAKTDAWQQLALTMQTGPKIISPSYYGCSSLEYALTYGIHVSGKHGRFLSDRVKKLYPSTYLYFPWGKVFYEGNREILPSSFIDSSSTYSLYIADYTPEKLNEIVDKLETEPEKYKAEVKVVMHLPQTSESVFSLRFISADREDSVAITVP